MTLVRLIYRSLRIFVGELFLFFFFFSSSSSSSTNDKYASGVLHAKSFYLPIVIFFLLFSFFVFSYLINTRALLPCFFSSSLALILNQHKYNVLHSKFFIIRNEIEKSWFDLLLDSLSFLCFFCKKLQKQKKIMNMNNRKSPIKQQRMKNSHSIPVANSNRMRSNSSMASSYPKNHSNSHSRHYSNTTSPVAMSASSLPAVPMFYTDTYADPPECSLLPKPPESWYLTTTNENLPIVTCEEKVQDKPKPKQKTFQKNHNRGFYSPFYSSRNQPQYISVKA